MLRSLLDTTRSNLPSSGSSGASGPAGTIDHYTTVFQSHQAERAIRICSALIERVRLAQHIAHPIHIAFDEWNVWYRTRSHEDRVGGVEERYNLSDALAVAAYLNGFIRHCRTVRMTNFAQFVNAIAPTFTSPQGLFLQTIYHPLRLYVYDPKPKTWSAREGNLQVTQFCDITPQDLDTAYGIAQDQRRVGSALLTLRPRGPGLAWDDGPIAPGSAAEACVPCPSTYDRCVS